MLLPFLPEISKSWSRHSWWVVQQEQRPSGNPFKEWRMKDWTLVRILFIKLSPDPKSNISSLGWGVALARFSEPEKQQEVGSNTQPSVWDSVQCRSYPIIPWLNYLSWFPSAQNMKLKCVFMTEGHSQSGPSRLLLWFHLLSLPTTHPMFQLD